MKTFVYRNNWIDYHHPFQGQFMFTCQAPNIATADKMFTQEWHGMNPMKFSWIGCVVS